MGRDDPISRGPLDELVGYHLRRAQVAVFQDFARAVDGTDVTPGLFGVLEIIAASMVHTIKKHGPDRIAGFSPIPAISRFSESPVSKSLWPPPSISCAPRISAMSLALRSSSPAASIYIECAVPAIRPGV